MLRNSGSSTWLGDERYTGDLELENPLGAVQMGLGWKNAFGTGKGVHTTTSGIEGAWKPNPTKWDMGFFDMLFGYEWELVKSPAGAHQRLAKDVKLEHMIPDAHNPSEKHRPMMTTADLSLRFDPIYEKISRRFPNATAEFRSCHPASPVPHHRPPGCKAGLPGRSYTTAS